MLLQRAIDDVPKVALAFGRGIFLLDLRLLNSNRDTRIKGRASVERALRN